MQEASNEKTSRRHHNRSPQKPLTKTKQRQQKKNKAAIVAQKRKDTELVYLIYTTIRHHFPELYDWMREIDDCRNKASEYELAAHLTACLALFLFKAESRNGYNQLRENPRFRDNYEKLFHLPMPHGDSVHHVIERLDETQIEQLTRNMIKVLLERKVFHKSRYRKTWFRVAIDGSGVVSFDHKHCDQCLHKTGKKGKKTWFHNVLEARLVTPNGFSILLASEWIENPADGDYDKQDCERKAFRRLAVKLKKAFPRLPIILLADGLYPYQEFFAICRDNQWAYSITFKEGCLKTVWEEVHGLMPLQAGNHYQQTRYAPGGKKVMQEYRWVNGIDYHTYSLNWLECRESVTEMSRDQDGSSPEKTEVARFVHITDLPLNAPTVADSSHTGRLRWKIENEGFNTLKHGGYAMQHKYARKSYRAMKNYYQFMQMAYLINQLMVKSIHFEQHYLKAKNHPTLKSLWQDLKATMKWARLKSKCLQEIMTTRRQFRLVT